MTASNKSSTDPSMIRWWFKNRMLVALTAVTFLWLTNWRMVSFVVSFSVSAPPVGVAESSRDSTKTMLDDEGIKYGNCVRAQLRQCQNNLQHSKSAGQLQIDNIAARNSHLLQQAKDSQSQCSFAVQSIHGVLATTGQTKPPQFRSTDSCMIEVRNDIRDASVSDLQALHLDTFSTFSDYVHMSRIIVESLAEYSVARIRYDREYFLGNGTSSLKHVLDGIDVSNLNVRELFQTLVAETEKLVSCISLRSTAGGRCPFSLGTRSLLETGLIEPLTQKVDYLVLNIENFSQSITLLVDELDKRTRILSEMLQGAHRVALEANVPLSALPDVFHVDLSFPASEAYKPSPFNLNLQFSVPSIDAIWEEVSHAQEQFRNSLAQAESDVVKRVKTSTDQIFGELNNFLALENYTPPVFGVSGDFETDILVEKDSHSETSQRVLDAATLMLEELLNISQKTRSGLNATGPQHQATNNTRTPVSFPMLSRVSSLPTVLSPRLPIYRVPIQTLSNLFKFFIRNFHYFEVAYQAWRSFHLLRKYWTIGSVEVPEIDSRKDKDGRDSRRGEFTVALIRWILAALLSLTVASTYWLYLQEEYISGCVLSNAGTSISTDLLVQLAFNNATKEGNDLLTAGLAPMQEQVSETCFSLLSTSSSSLREDGFALSSIMMFHNQTVDAARALERCLEIDDTSEHSKTWNGLRKEHAKERFGHAKHSFSPFPLMGDDPEEHGGGQLCPSDTAQWELEGSVFECGSIPVCSLTCSKGSNNNRIGLLVKESECMIEWTLVHSVFVRVFFVTVTHTALFFSKSCFVKGLKQLFWTRLHRKECVLLHTVDLTASSLTSGKTCVVCGPTGMSEQLQHSARRLECSGWESLVFAAVVTGTWLCVLFLLAETKHVDFIMWPAAWLG